MVSSNVPRVPIPVKRRILIGDILKYVSIFGRKIETSTILLFFILILAGALRFYRLPDMAGFDFDQEYAANFAYNVIHLHQKLLIGEGLSIQGLFMGPWYFYFLVPFFALTNLHPLGGYIGSVFLSLFGIVVLFTVAKKMFNDQVGLIAAFLSAVRFSSLNVSWSMVPAFSSSILVLITWFCFYRYWHSDTKVFPLLFFLFGLFTSIHPILFPLYFVFLILLVIKRKVPKFKEGGLSIVFFLIPISPLLLFEYWHSFLEVRRLLNLFGGGQGSVSKNAGTFVNYLQVIFDTPGHSLNIQLFSAETISAVVFIAFIILMVKKVSFFKDRFHLTALFITFFVYLVYYFFYPGHVPEYYFNALGTLLSLYFALTLSLLIKTSGAKFLLFAILLTITASNFYLLYNRWNNPSLMTLSKKDAIVRSILERQSKNQEFFVSFIATPGLNFGFDYLFKYYGRIPQTKAVNSSIYTIVIPKDLSPGSINYSAGNIGVIFPK